MLASELLNSALVHAHNQGYYKSYIVYVHTSSTADTAPSLVAPFPWFDITISNPISIPYYCCGGLRRVVPNPGATSADYMRKRG